MRTAKKKQALAQSQSQVQAQAKCDNNERLECLNQLEQSVEISETVCEKKFESAESAETAITAIIDNRINNSGMNADNADKTVNVQNNNTSMGGSNAGSSKTYQINVLQAHRLEIWFANLGFNQGKYNETGVRPVLILSNDIANTVSPIVTVAPMTSRLHKLYLPTHILIYPWEVSDVNAVGAASAVNNAEQHSAKGHYHKQRNHKHNYNHNHKRSYKRDQEYQRKLQRKQRRQSRQSRQLYSRLGCVLLEQITLLDKRQLRNCIGKVTSPERIKILNDAIKNFLVLV